MVGSRTKFRRVTGDNPLWHRFVVVGLLAGLGWLTTCIAFVDETEYALLTRWGALVGNPITAAGPVLKLPWPIDQLRRLDRRLQLCEPPAFERLTRDKKSLSVGGFVCWRIDRERVQDFLLRLGSIENANARLEELLAARLAAAIGRVDLTDLVAIPKEAPAVDNPPSARLEGLMTELTEEVRVAAKEWGMEVVDVRIRRFNHPSKVQPAIYARIASERERDAVRYRSEGEREYQRIKSAADLEREKNISAAEAKATELRGQAEAEKTRLLNQAQAKHPQFYQWVRTLEAYQKMLDEKTTLVLSADGPLFRLLTDVEGKNTPPSDGRTKSANGSPMNSRHPAQRDNAPNGVRSDARKTNRETHDSGATLP